MTLQNTDQFIVHREGIDYQLAYEKLKADVLEGVVIPEAGEPPGDGKLTIKNADGTELGSFTANQAAAADITLPAGFSGDYNDLINKPEIPELVEPPAPGDGKLTIKDEDDNVLGEFTANQGGDTEVVIPAGGSSDDECPVHEVIDNKYHKQEGNIHSMVGPNLEYKETIENSIHWNESSGADNHLEYAVILYDEAYKHEGVKVKLRHKPEEGWIESLIRGWAHKVLEDGRDVLCFHISTTSAGTWETLNPGSQVTLSNCSTVYWDDIEDKPCLVTGAKKSQMIVDQKTNDSGMDQRSQSQLREREEYGETIEKSEHWPDATPWFNTIFYDEAFKEEGLRIEAEAREDRPDLGSLAVNTILAWEHTTVKGGDLDGTPVLRLAWLKLDQYGSAPYKYGDTISLSKCENQTLNDGKLTINNADGSEVGTFTANQADDVTITLPAGGGGGLDDILNAPIVKGPKYTIWEDCEGVYTPMELIEGDGGNGSKFKTNERESRDDQQTSIDGTIQYKSSMDPETNSASICMAQVKNLTSVALTPDGQEGYEGTEIESVAMGGGCFHSHAIKKEESFHGPQGWPVSYLLKLEFVNCNGDTDTLYVDATTKNYVAMRREDIDLREMEALDAQIKAQMKAENAKRRAERGKEVQAGIDAAKKANKKS